MKLSLLLLLVFFCNNILASKFHEGLYQQSFHHFVTKYSKSYAHDEFLHRYKIYKDNYDLVVEHNEKNLTYKLAMNHLGDLTFEEFKSNYLGVKLPKNLYMTRSKYASPFIGNATDIPTNFDWRQKGAVTPVKDQGQCGSCYSFSTTGSVEGCHFISTGSLVSLSEQNIIDCSWGYGNNGCNGGLMTNSMDYIITNNGIDTEESYPYNEVAKHTCKFNKKDVGATLKSYNNIPSGDEQALLKAAVKGPVSIAIDASQPSFQFYSTGIYYEPNCSSEDLDHGVLLVGWGTEDDGDYWIVKNSWSAQWGEDGYIKMARNKKNHCGVATMATLPVC